MHLLEDWGRSFKFETEVLPSIVDRYLSLFTDLKSLCSPLNSLFYANSAYPSEMFPKFATFYRQFKDFYTFYSTKCITFLPINSIKLINRSRIILHRFSNVCASLLMLIQLISDWLRLLYLLFKVWKELISVENSIFFYVSQYLLHAGNAACIVSQQGLRSCFSACQTISETQRKTSQAAA